MSWLQENYEKAALGVAAIAAIGLGVSVFSSMGAVEEDFSLPDLNEKDSDLAPGIGRAEFTIAEMGTKHSFRQPTDSAGRKVDLVTGIPLFAQKDKKEPVDLLKSADVHEDIPNTWWLEYGVDPSFSNSPQMDADGDGFTNLEEAKAKTNPSDGQSHPPLIDKLRLVGLKKHDCKMRVSAGGGDTFNIRFNDIKDGKRRKNKSGFVPVGTVLFDKEPAKGRYKLVGTETREEVNPRTKVVTQRLFAKVEDLSSAKKGKIYDVTSSSKGSIYTDYTAILALNAMSVEDERLKILEGTSFTLPVGDEKKTYKFLSVNDDGEVVIEYSDAAGAKQTKNLPLVGQ